MNDTLLWSFVGLYFVGFICACGALLESRTPQGATAWVMSLIFIPFLSVPFYLTFGRTKFKGYNTKRRLMDSKVDDEFKSLKTFDDSLFSVLDEIKLLANIINTKGVPGFTRRNSVELLIDAEVGYASMLEELEKATNYIIFQFYIFRDDEIGNKFADVLMRKAREGVRVSFIFDEIVKEFSKEFIEKMKDSGVKIAPFNEHKWLGHAQVNFRNHRKIVIVDGKVGFIGGLNIGDDYLGKYPKIGPWRDTHLRFKGPAVIAAQLTSAKDWMCAVGKPIEADWEIYPSEEDANVLVLSTGPADEKHVCLLSHIALINSAKERVWIANPYFVPPEPLVDAIFLAILRGVDVRILVPSYTDARSILLASQIYQEKVIDHGGRIYRYSPGFLHQKVMLIDNCFASVGSVNFDYRSMYINFEVTTISTDKKFVSDVEQMLEKDFSVSERALSKDYKEQPLFKKISVRGANLLAPIL
ncbi:MAG TPA: cardiolipin synthase [Bacteriovoracaceae bacterium]|nr:cardiolipin synthase [Bacteriovoracaceae bacterium]